MAEEAISPTDRIDQTPYLFSTGTNECSVTKLPYENDEVRKKLVDIVDQAISQKRSLVYLYGDMDNLKEFNDLFGHKTGNEAIRTMVSGFQEVVSQQEGLALVCFFRPQSGGDEVEALLVLDESQTNLSKKVEDGLFQPFNFMVEGKPKEVRCSFGYSFQRFKGNEDAVSQLEILEKEAIEQLDILKAKRLTTQIDETIESGRKMGVDEYRELVTKTWLVRGPGGKALDILFRHFEAKLIKKVLTN